MIGGRQLRLALIAATAALAGGTWSDALDAEWIRAGLEAACAGWLSWCAFRLRPDSFAATVESAVAEVSGAPARL